MFALIARRIDFKSYRNINCGSVEFADGVNVLYGANANGKTNTVEALYQFAVGKAFRAANFTDVVSFGDSACETSLTFLSESDRRTCGMNIRIAGGKVKQFRYNGIYLDKISDFIGKFRAVLFTPDHLGLVKGTPETRRRFLDMAVCQLKPVYISCLVAYSKLISQRNALLKVLRQTPDPGRRAELDVWTDKLIQYSAVVTRYRAEYIAKLSETAPKFYAGLAEGETLELSYISQVNRHSERDCAGLTDTAAVENLYREVFERGTENEIRYGVSLYGPHHDDLYVGVCGKPAKTIASQGQQRSAVLALKLAEGDVSGLFHGEYPVFLFDDILSELDPSRKKHLLSGLAGRQVIITCCDPEIIGGFGGINKIKVSGGEFSYE